MTWFWLVIFYSFGGYLLEKGYAAVVRSPHRVRKCFLLLPLCPVYGLAMLAAGHLPPPCTEPFWRLVLYGGLTCTAVEYAVHFLYEKLLGVLFWDYSDTKLDLNRRICFPFAVVWGLLSAVVDNIPIMFAVLKMKPPMDHGQWLLVTLTAGVGGSLLSIGSAAGVALMGASRGAYTFNAHLRWFVPIAVGYAASIACHLWLNARHFTP